MSTKTVDLINGNVEVFSDNCNLLLKDLPVFIHFPIYTDSSLPLRYRYAIPKNRTILDLSTSNDLLDKSTQFLFTNHLGLGALETKKIKFLNEIQANKYAYMAFAIFRPTTLVLIFIDKIIFLPIPVPISEDILYPLAGTWRKGDLVIFYKNITTNKLHVAIFKVTRTYNPDSAELELIQTKEINVFIEDTYLFQVYAQYFELNEKELQTKGLFYIQFVESNKIIIISDDFRVAEKITGNAIVLDNDIFVVHTIDVFSDTDPVICFKTKWVLEQLLGDNPTLICKKLEEKTLKDINNVAKIVRLQKFFSYTYKFATNGDGIYIIRTDKNRKAYLPASSWHTFRRGYAFKLIVNNSKTALKIYKRNLDAILKEYGISFVNKRLAFLARNVLAGVANDDGSHSPMNFIKMDTITQNVV